MATVTRTFSITTDDAIFAALDAAMVYVYGPQEEIAPIPGEEYTTQCIKNWLVDVAQKSVARQTDLAIQAATQSYEQNAEQAIALVKSLQIGVT